MNANTMDNTYKRYQNQYAEVKRMGRHFNLSEADYIQLAMTADILSYQEHLVAKFGELEKVQQAQAISQSQYAKRFEELLQGSKK